MAAPDATCAYARAELRDIPRRIARHSAPGGENPMMLSRRRFLHGVSAAAAAGAVAPARVARAQAWPSRPVRLVVGFPAGGGADAVTRIVANRLSEIWSQQVVVENRGGAGGSIASDAIAYAAPARYSIPRTPNPLAVTRLLFP